MHFYIIEVSHELYEISQRSINTQNSSNTPWIFTIYKEMESM